MTTKEDNGATGAGKRRLRIACCSTPYSGHMNPMMSLVETLVERTNADGDNENEVCFVTIAWDAADRIESRCQTLGIQLVKLSLGKGFESWEAMKPQMNGSVVFPALADRSKPFMEGALDAFQPDVIVSDFCCLASQEYAASRNLPLVINWTGPYKTLQSFLRSVVAVSDDQCYFSAGGLLVSYIRLDLFSALVCFNVKDFGTFSQRILSCVNCGNSLVLVNSFWGFEKPQLLLHPNIVSVGPIHKALPRLPDFSGSHPELYTFLHAARASNRKVLLVTTGTMVQLEAWTVRLLWEAFEVLSRDHSTSVVWSLKEDPQGFLSEEQLQHPAFHFSTWLPQPALLASDLVDGVFTHCGWGGTLECISGGKPVVVLPFFLDQMDNSKLLLEAGCAVTVAAIPAFNTDSTGHSAYSQPTNDLGYGPKDLRERLRRCKLSKLTAEGVTAGCAKLLGDPRYKVAAQRLKAISSGPGMGRDFAGDLIEHAGRQGLRHLTSSGPSPSRRDNDNEDEDDKSSYPRAATHANRLTGHRPLVFTLAMCAITGAAAAALNRHVIQARSR